MAENWEVTPEAVLEAAIAMLPEVVQINFAATLRLNRIMRGQAVPSDEE